MHKVIIASLLALMLGGCGGMLAERYPLGMTEQEWHALTPAQQLDARERQQQLDMEARAQREAAEQERALIALEEQRLLEQRRASAGYGERVQCVVDDAQGYIASKWRSVEPAGADLIVGEQVQLFLSRKGSNQRGTRALISFDGQTVELCDTRGRDCARLVSTTRGFDRGASTRVELSSLRARLHCELPEPAAVRRRF